MMTSASRLAGFRLLPDETLEGVLAAYDEVARHTDEVVATVFSLNDAWPLPEAPWFPPGESWSARRSELYTALGHPDSAFAEPVFRRHLSGALEWLTA
jgi:Protein of unknown function (DUF664)